jgi:acyl CoA:acetate/3-ketoacid CoA transferase alpha subunit
MINKVVDNADVAIAGIQDGAVLILGGFGLCGIQENILRFCTSILKKTGCI